MAKRRFPVKLFIVWLLGLCTVPLRAYAFIVQDISIKGLQHVSRETVLSYLPIKIGQSFLPAQSPKTISTLYATGFFNNVCLEEDGNHLIIKVTERPLINEVTIHGNKELPKDKLKALLKEMGLVRGVFFDKAALERFITQVRLVYDSQGKFSARVTPLIKFHSTNSLSIDITISEGLTTEVADISIIGNHAFSERILRFILPMTSHHFWSFITGSDQYTQDRLSATLEALQVYYMDRGYLKFKIDSVQAALTPNKKEVYLIIRLSEGPPYRLGSYRLTSEQFYIPPQQLKKLLAPLRSGQVFSRKKVLQVEQAIKKTLSEDGYIFSTVNTLPILNESCKTVSLIFYIDKGNRVYVRHINIKGNLKTQDRVFRRLLRQQEASVVSQSQIKESIRRLSLSGFVEGEPQLTAAPIPGFSDQVDLDFTIHEAHAAQAIFSLGYGTNGSVVGASLNQSNVFGTGNQLGINFNNTRAVTLYNISYNNPFYTLNGVQRGYDIFYQRTTPSDLNTTTYSTNTYGGNLHYSIPLNEQGDSLLVSGGAQKLQLNLPRPTDWSAEVKNFVLQHGTQFNQFMLTVGWSRNTLDRLVFPRKGTYQTADAQLVLPMGGKPLDYYKLNYTSLGYYPLGSRLILEERLSLGFGNGFASTRGLPFFANYYAGGVGTNGQVRGYEISSLGPRDSNARPLGANILTVGSLALIVPSPLPQLRPSFFIDAGNVYSTLGVTHPGDPRGGTASGPLRYSAGINVDWRVPVFNVTLSVSIAKAINARPGDQIQAFQFNIGTNF